jgi:hypothetical protein
MPIPAARGGTVNDAGTLTMVVLPAQPLRLPAALTDRTGRSGWCRSRSSPHPPKPRHHCGAPRNGSSPTRASWRASATGSINSSSGWQRWNGANHHIRPLRRWQNADRPTRSLQLLPGTGAPGKTLPHSPSTAPAAATTVR